MNAEIDAQRCLQNRPPGRWNPKPLISNHDGARLGREGSYTGKGKLPFPTATRLTEFWQMDETW
jgi:hypothetical protein